MILPGTTSKSQSKLVLLLLCLSSSLCYGQTEEKSIPPLEISSKEQIASSTPSDNNSFIEKKGQESTQENNQNDQSLASSPIQEEISLNLLNATDPIPSLPVSISEVIPSISHTIANEESSLRLISDNLPKPYLKIPTKSAEALPSFIKDPSRPAKAKPPERKAIRAPNVRSQIDLIQVFAAAPWIYSILAVLLLYAFGIGFYNLYIIRKSLKFRESFVKSIVPKIEECNFEDIISTCEKDSRLLSKLVLTSINCRSWGLQAMLDHMKSEGRRHTQTIWHRIGILSDVAMIAPLLGLLGTVVGMFFAFNDVSRSANSLLQFMDGLGVSIGTTVAGLLVAISAICFQTLCRDRLARAVVKVEQNALDIARLVDRKSR